MVNHMFGLLFMRETVNRQNTVGLVRKWAYVFNNHIHIPRLECSVQRGNSSMIATVTYMLRDLTPRIW